MRTLILSGRLGANAEVKLTKTGSQYLEFRMANSEFGDEEGQTYWFRVVSFNANHLNLAPHLTKGKPIEVIGELKTRGYVNATTNKIEVGHDVRACDIKFDSNFGRSQEGGDGNATATSTHTATTTTTPATAPAAPKKTATRNPSTKPVAQAPAPPTSQPATDDSGVDDLPF